MRYDIGAAGADRATVTVAFQNFDPQRLEYDLVRERGRWVIDEVNSLGRTKWVLSSILKGAR